MRRFVKETLIGIFAHVRRDGAAKVVFYHDIGKEWTPMGTSKEIFLEHMKCLRDGDVICFDDGFRGIWNEREKWASGGVKTIVFLALGLVGKSGYLTWDEIGELQDKYGFNFQCHTWSHQTLAGPYNQEVPEPLGGRTDEWYRHELLDSKAELERRLGKPVTSLCLPVGHFSDDVIRRCREAGYKKVYASYPGNVTDEYIQPRCLVQDLSPNAFKNVLNGGMAPLARRYMSRHYFHDMADGSAA